MVEDKTQYIPFEDLKPNNYNPRKTFRGSSLEELKENIKNMGLIEPLVVRPLKPLKNNKFEIVCGMRRYHALKALKQEKVLCIIKKLTNTQALDMSFSENMQRDSLTPIEQAKMYWKRITMMKGFDKKDFDHKFMSQYSPLVEELSKLYNKSAYTIGNRLQLLYLPEDLQKAIETKVEKKRKLPLGTAFQIARFHTINDDKLAETYMLDMYKQYDENRNEKGEAIYTRDDISKLVTKQIEQYTTSIENQETLLKSKVNNIEAKIEKTKESKDKEIVKIARLMCEVYSNKSFVDIDFNKLPISYETEDEETIEKIVNTIIEECETDVDILDINERENIRLKGAFLLIFLKNKELEYNKDETYKNLSITIEEIGSRLTDTQLLLTKVKKYNINVCPFCLAGIETGSI